MPRPLRIQYEGAIYHLMSRGDHREPVYRDDIDREHFLATLGETCGKTGWQVHGYCLMPNHFHLVVETPQANLVAGMKWLLGTYTLRFNRRHKLTGHLFSGRYKALLVDGRSSGYLRTVCEYVHLNPVRARLLRPDQPLRAFPWSSFPGYLQAPAKRPAWLRVDRLLGEMRIPSDTSGGRREFEHQLEARRQAEAPGDWKELRRNWCLGDQSFRTQLLTLVTERSSPGHYAGPRRELAEARAEQLVQDELHRRNWSESALSDRRKGDPEKIQIARRLRKETTVSLRWIAGRLRMGMWTNLANCLYQRDSTIPHTAAAARPRSGKNRRPAAPTATNDLELSIVRTDPFVEQLPTHCL